MSESPEGAALKLLDTIAACENRVFHTDPSPEQQSADRAWVLDTYAECLQATHARRITEDRRKINRGGG